MDQKMKEQIRKIARAAAQKQVSASKETYAKPRTVSVPPIPAYKPSTPNYKPAAPAYKLPKPTTIKPHVPKSATMFYTAPEKGGIISSSDTPKSLKQRLDEMQRKQEAIAAADRQQYQDMLKGLNTDKLDAQRKQYEAELSDMKTAYAQAMGVGSERKPKNQLTPESKNDADFWAGFRKGLGLKDGEEIGRESVGRNSDGNLTGRGNASGGRPTWGGSPISTGNIGGRPGFSAQDGILHGPGLNDEETEPIPMPSPGPIPGTPPVEENHPDMVDHEAQVGSYYNAYYAWREAISPKNPVDYENYNLEVQRRRDALWYYPSEDLILLVDQGIEVAQYGLDAAIKRGDKSLIEKYQIVTLLYDAIDYMNETLNSSGARPSNDILLTRMEEGLYSINDLNIICQQELQELQSGGMGGGLAYKAMEEKSKIFSDQIIAINRGMNVVGEAYLDEIDQKRRNNELTAEQQTLAYRDYYQAVIQRESLIDIESKSIKEDNLTMASYDTGYDYNLYNYLLDYDIPLYTTEEDAVFAFKKEAMPLTLESNTEHSAILDTVEMLDLDTGQVQTYYYYSSVTEGADDNVVFHTLVGAGGGGHRMLLHTHPVDGPWNRNFSGDPQNDGLFNKFLDNPEQSLWGEMGDSTVPRLGYQGIYVITSAAEVKLYEGFGESTIGSGYNTHANTADELRYISTIDLY